MRSSFCESNACVDVILSDNNLILVSNPSYPGQGDVEFSRQEWAAFIKGVKAGEFDFED